LVFLFFGHGEGYSSSRGFAHAPPHLKRGGGAKPHEFTHNTLRYLASPNPDIEILEVGDDA
jgi:hypothetical protein